jgi:hypothetical protein
MCPDARLPREEATAEAGTLEKRRPEPGHSGDCFPTL